MASTLSLSKTTPVDEMAVRGVRRSRLSLHFNTPRVRRWFLVQMVSIPNDASREESNYGQASFAKPKEGKRKSLGKLLDEHQMTPLWRFTM